jgi:hypothetical protein
MNKEVASNVFVKLANLYGLSMEPMTRVSDLFGEYFRENMEKFAKDPNRELLNFLHYSDLDDTEKFSLGIMMFYGALVNENETD